jgi:hypothetical protein
VLSAFVTSTVIILGLPPSLSPMSTKPCGVVSTTVYTPGGTSSNTNTPLESVVVLATTVPLGDRSSTTTPTSGVSPTELLSVSSRTTPLIVRRDSSTKLLSVELLPGPRTTWIELSLGPSVSVTETYPAKSDSTTVYMPAGKSLNT